MTAFLSMVVKFLCGLAVGAAVSLAIYPRMYRNWRKRAWEDIPEMEGRYRERVRELDEKLAALNGADPQWEKREMHIEEYFTQKHSLAFEHTLKMVDEF